MSRRELQTWFLRQLKGAYDAELQVEASLPRLAEACTGQQTRGALLRHLLVSRVHIQRVQEIIKSLDEKPNGIRCPAMRGILTELDDILQEPFHGEVLDSGLITVLLKAEHYQRATYRTVQIYGGLLLDENSLEALAGILEEKEAARSELIDLAVNHFFASHLNEAFMAG